MQMLNILWSCPPQSFPMSGCNEIMESSPRQCCVSIILITYLSHMVRNSIKMMAFIQLISWYRNATMFVIPKLINISLRMIHDVICGIIQWLQNIFRKVWLIHTKIVQFCQCINDGDYLLNWQIARHRCSQHSPSLNKHPKCTLTL